MRKIAMLLVGLVAILGLSTACSSSPVTYQPVGYGPTWNGNQYCGWLESPLECQNSGINQLYWGQMGYTQPVGYVPGYGGSLASSLFYWNLAYSPWYSSPRYYNTYVPASYRTVYVQHNTTFNHTYATQTKAAASTATYKGSNGKTVSGTKVKTSQLKPAKNNGGSGGTKKCGAGLSLVDQGISTKIGGGGSSGGSSGGGSHGSSGGGSKSGGGSGGSKTGGGSSNKSNTGTSKTTNNSGGNRTSKTGC